MKCPPPPGAAAASEPPPGATPPGAWRRRLFAGLVEPRHLMACRNSWAISEHSDDCWGTNTRSRSRQGHNKVTPRSRQGHATEKVNQRSQITQYFTGNMKLHVNQSISIRINKRKYFNILKAIENNKYEVFMRRAFVHPSNKVLTVPWAWLKAQTS